MQPFGYTGYRYDYGGFAANISYGIPVVDTTISLGVVRNVYEPVDFKGEFDALYTYNILKGWKNYSNRS